MKPKHLFSCYLLLHAVVAIAMQFTAHELYAVDIAQVNIPGSLGKITTKQSGGASPLVVLIGETHVDLTVQRNVSELLGYLHGAYGMRAACTEGTDSFPERTGILGRMPTASRQAELDARLRERALNGFEHFAFSYPTVKVYGVEDMDAFRAHGRELEAHEDRSKRWMTNFATFVQNDLAGVKVTKADGERLSKAFEAYFKEHRDFTRLAAVFYDTVGRASATGSKVAVLEGEYVQTKRIAKLVSGEIPTTEDPLFVKRDTAMVRSTLLRGRESKSQIVGLVVGKAHVSGIESILRKEGVAFITIIPAGVDETLGVRKPPAGVSEEEWLKTLKSENELYSSWKRGDATVLEQALERLRTGKPLQLKPPPATQRLDFRDVMEIEQAAVAAQDMLRSGKSWSSIQSWFAPFRGEGIEVKTAHLVEGGVEVLVKLGEREVWFVRGSGAMRPPAGGNWVTLTESVGGGRRMIISGRGGELPPGPPFPPIPATPLPPYSALFAPYDGKRKPAVVVYFHHQEEMWSQVGGQVEPLGITRSGLLALIAAAENAPEGAEKALAAQRLARVLLRSLENAEIPIGQILMFTSEDDILKKQNLVSIAYQAGGHAFPRTAALVECSYLPWEKVRATDPIVPGAHLQQGSLALWLSAQVASIPDYRGLTQRLRGLGIKVNEPLATGDSLVVFAAENEAQPKILLTDGTSHTLTSDARMFSKAAAVAGFGIALSGRTDLKWVMEMRAVTDKNLKEVVGIIAEAMRREVGKKSLEGALRETAKEATEPMRALGEYVPSAQKVRANVELAHEINQSAPRS